MNIKELVSKLNTLNINDFRNIDIKKLHGILKQSPVIVINLVILIGTAFLSMSLINKSATNQKKYTATSAEYKKKLSAVQDQMKIKKEYEEFIKIFPKSLSKNQLVDKFSDLAGNRKVQILSLLPAKENNDQYLNQTSVNLSIESNEFKNIILFIKDIEEFPYAIRLEQFTVKMSESNSINSADTNSKENSIRADINVSSLIIK